jgi:hypothetical protein
MVDRRRDARSESLRERISSGASCPFCNSPRLEVDTTFQVSPAETAVSLQRREFRGESDKPYEFVRVNCFDCGYVLFFDPARFGAALG